MPFGYTGKIVKINLSTKDISIENPPETFYRRYFGGETFIAYYLLKELNPNTDPFSPDNLLIFATGVMTGHPFSGSGRNSVGGKSPLTEGFGSSEVGGYWGSELKRSGYDAIVLKGSCKEPSYIWIQNNKIEIRDGSHLWGKTSGDVEEHLKKDLGQNIRIAQIGPAGEKKVRYACIINDLSHFAGRTGLGAVMGSKNLKAIVIRGNKTPPIFNPEALKERARWIATDPNIVIPNGKTVEFFRKYGTPGGLLALNESGGLPTRNFSEGVFEDAENISGERMAETILDDTHTCYGCVIRCKRNAKVTEPYTVDPKYGGPEYETLASLGSNCGVKDLKAIAKANEICNKYGVDTISTGVSISFAMECFQKKLITQKDSGGITLHFGDSDAMLQMVEEIAQREKFGRILGEGVKRASEHIGKESWRFAVHVKGQEVPMHEPRLKKGLGIGYAVSPTGADHIHNMHDTLYQKVGANMKELQALGILEPLSANALNPKKIRLLIYESCWKHFMNSAVLCYFTPWYNSNTPSLVNAVSGWNTTTWELMKVGERAITMARAFNLREGLTSDDDMLPARIAQPLKSGPTAGEKIIQEEVNQCKEIYYRMLGWDEKGVPTNEKLYELDIDWAIDQLPKS